jgi:CRP-like cAMP-binding protein
MRTQAAHLEHLKTIPLFSYCTQKELRKLAARCTAVPAQAGRTLIRQGSVGDEFFVVVAGRGEVSRDGVVVDTVGPGDYFGELAMLDRAPRNATVTVTDEMDLLVFSRSDFEGALFAAPLMTRKLLAGMASRLRGLDQRNRGEQLLV